MQLALTPEVLFPLGACAVVAVAVIAVVVVFVRSRSATAEDASPPTSADWTGEAATAEPAHVERSVLPTLPPRLTVAEAIAVRDADTAPLPITSAMFVKVPQAVAPPAGTGDSLDAGPEQPDVVEAGERRSDQDPTEQSADVTAVVAHAGSDAEPGPAASAPPAENLSTEPTGAEQDTLAEPAVPAEQAGEVVPPHAPATSAGSSPTVAAAVAHVLAVRAAANRGPVEPAVPSRTADARDRLLAVLLADPARAVGAAEELVTCRGQLGDVLSRLAASGLTTEQLARLSGFSVEQITTLVERQNV